MIKKIICITPIKHIKGAFTALKNKGVVFYEPYIKKDVLKRKIISDNINIIFTNPNKQKFILDKYILENSNIKIICTASTGTNHIDINYCTKNNIKIFSLSKDYNIIKTITSTAEMSFTLMLCLIRHVIKATNSVKQYKWNYEKYIGRQLNHLTIGIIGYGRLGKQFAKFCEPFFNNIYIHDPYKTVCKNKKYHQVELDDLLFLSDIIVLHVHLNQETFYLINEKTIKKMKNGVYIINTSRGDVVNEFDIIQALKNKKINGYATDVLSDELKESVEKSIVIKAMNKGLNIIISPHIGGMTVEAQEIAYLNSIKKL